MDALRIATLLAARLTTALMAGLFFAYSCSVLPALRGADAAVLVEVMQRINRAIRPCAGSAPAHRAAKLRRHPVPVTRRRPPGQR